MSSKLLNLVADFQVKGLLDEAGDGALMIAGYANTVAKDRHNDVIVKEAWEKGGLDNYKKNPIVLAFHDHTKPIGSVQQLHVDDNGLQVVARISKAAGDVYSLVKEGVLKTFSVGFRIKDADYDNKTDIFVIKDLELMEISVVSVPANQDSTFSLAKCFESNEDFEEFKKSFKNIDEASEEVEKETEKSSAATDASEQEESYMSFSKEDLESVVKAATEAAAAVAAKTVEAAKAAEKEAAEKAAAIQLGQSGTEKLLAEVEKRFSDAQSGLMKSVEDLRGELKEKDAEIKSIRESKISFEEKQASDVPYAEKEAAFLLAKATGKKLTETKLWDNIVQKYGAHVPSADWELTISTNMQEEIRRRLIIAPLFRQITMNTPVMKMPVNPEAGYASWVQASAYKTAGSSGSEGTHALKELTLSAHKLATKEFLGNEEEDDSIIPLLPIIREAVVRRMAKGVDKALLLGTAQAADPLKGIATYEAGTANTTVTTTAKVTNAELRAMRRKLGVWGLDPQSLLYVVSQDVYYDLLDDPDFLTVDKVGSRSTLLTGQIGSVAGTPVIVSAEFAAKTGGTSGSVGAVALNTANFMMGNYKSLRVESDYLVEDQMRLLVASLRMGFQQITTVDGNGVSALRWT